MHNVGWKVTLLGGAALIWAGPALAQDAPAAQEPAAQAGAEIIVTAQKREERLQDVPASVAVVSGDLLERQGGVNIENAQYLVPSLTFRKSGTAINQSLFLRGVGTSTFSIAGEPSISTIVDGVVYARAGEAFSDLIDLERIEVLRGPQGTLFGKNASAGVINIVTRRPGDEIGGYAEAGYFSNGNEYRGRAALDLPLGDAVKTRFTGFYGEYDGNIRNTVTGDRVNGYQRWGVRGMLVADPTPDLTLTLIGDYRESDDDCCGEVIGTTPSGLIGGALPAPRGDRTRQLAQDLVTATIEKSWGVSLQLDATLGTHTVTSITAYRDYANREIRDGDFLPRAYVGFNQLHDDGPQIGDTFSQELRLASPGNQTIDYVLGAFFSHAYSERTFTRRDIVCTLMPAPTALTPCTAPGTVVTTPNGSATFGSTFKNFALFGQATWNLTDRLRLIGGLRYTTDQLDIFHSRRTALAGPGINPNFDQGVYNEYLRLVATGVSPTAAQTQAVAASNGIPFRAKTTSDNWSGKVGAQFDIADQSTAYASFTRGYKGPAFNVFFNLTATGTNAIEPEDSDSYEIGLKNTLFDGALVLNLAGFYAKYRNFQANNPDTVAGVLVTRFTNAGEVSTRGGELDLIWRPARDVSVSGGLAYTKARVDQFKVPTNGVVTGIIPSGTELGFAPEWKASLALDYRLRTGGGVDFGFNADGAYQSSQLAQFDASPVVRDITTIDGYGIVNLGVSVIHRDDRFRVTAFVKNLFDESFAASIASGGPGGGYRYIIPREADRYFGVVGRVNF